MAFSAPQNPRPPAPAPPPRDPLAGTGLTAEQIAQARREMEDAGLRFEADGRVYRIVEGHKSYVPPWIAWRSTSVGVDTRADGTSQLNALGTALRTPGSDPNSIWHFMFTAGGPFTNRSTWDPEKGTYEGSIDWLQVITTALAGGVIGAGIAASFASPGVVVPPAASAPPATAPAAGAGAGAGSSAAAGAGAGAADAAGLAEAAANAGGAAAGTTAASTIPAVVAPTAASTAASTIPAAVAPAAGPSAASAATSFLGLGTRSWVDLSLGILNAILANRAAGAQNDAIERWIQEQKEAQERDRQEAERLRQEARAAREEATRRVTGLLSPWTSVGSAAVTRLGELMRLPVAKPTTPRSAQHDFTLPGAAVPGGRRVTTQPVPMGGGAPPTTGPVIETGNSSNPVTATGRSSLGAAFQAPIPAPTTPSPSSTASFGALFGGAQGQPTASSQTVTMRAPNGDMAQVPMELVPYYENLGGQRVSA